MQCCIYTIERERERGERDREHIKCQRYVRTEFGYIFVLFDNKAKMLNFSRFFVGFDQKREI